MWLMLLAIWGPTALASIAGLYFTHDARCLLVMLIPAFMHIKTGDNDERDTETD